MRIEVKTKKPIQNQKSLFPAEYYKKKYPEHVFEYLRKQSFKLVFEIKNLFKYFY